MYTGGRARAVDSHALLGMVKGECAPALKDRAAPSVCSDTRAVDTMRRALAIPAQDAAAVVTTAKLRTGCDSESCVFKKIPELAGQLDQRFTPKGPWRTTAWLSNRDIDDVLEQYRAKFPKFRHIEFQMRDFAKRGGALAQVNWSDVLQNSTSLACALNTDLSSGMGEHWTAFYIDVPGGTVEYFDSAGQEPHQEFIDFGVATAAELSRRSGRKFEFVPVTKVEHQKENTECGVYTLYYILSRLHDVPYRAFEYRHVPDREMEQFRKHLFRNS